MKRTVPAAALAACLAFASTAKAQTSDASYQNAVGVVFGWWVGGAISLKHFIKDNSAIEARVSFYQYGGEAAGFYEYYGDIPNLQNLRWYVGAGGHFGVYNHEWSKEYSGRQDGAYLGPDGILGIDYKFDGAPIDLSFDIEPRFDFPGAYFNVWGGLGVRFAF